MRDYAYLPIDVVRTLLPEAEKQRVSLVARSPNGFLRAYDEAGGDPNRLPEHWRRTRHGFIARHRAQASARHERWWTPGGEPTRRHLALVIWAHSPSMAKLAGYLEHGGGRARSIGSPALRRFYDRHAELSRRTEIHRDVAAPTLIVHKPGQWGGEFVPGGSPTIHLYPSESLALNRAILIHELCHWVRHHTGDPHGYHDEPFCVVLDRMYQRAHVDPRVARKVERQGGCLASA